MKRPCMKAAHSRSRCQMHAWWNRPCSRSGVPCQRYGRPFSVTELCCRVSVLPLTVVGLAGVHVIATARRLEVLRELTQLGMTTLELDVTKQESIEKCKRQVVDLTGGRLDILVNNA